MMDDIKDEIIGRLQGDLANMKAEREGYRQTVIHEAEALLQVEILARQKLGKERDRFGKREIELMRELEKYKSIAEILASLLKCAMTGEQSPTWFQHSVLSIEKYRALTTPPGREG